MNSIEVTNSPPIKDENYEKTASLLKVIAASQTPNDSGEDKHTIVRAILPCPFTRHKMFCPNPIFLRQSKNLTAFIAYSKTFVPAQKGILLNANHLFVWHKMFATATIFR